MAMDIRCPLCSRKVMTWQGISYMQKEVKCRNCNVLVIYDPCRNEIDVTRVTKRTGSSGVRFW